MKILALVVPELWDLEGLDRPWSWVHSSGRSGRLGQDPLPKSDWVRLILPQSAVLSARIKIERRGRWKEALPFALEDGLLSDPTLLEVVPGQPDQEGLTPVFAVDRQALKGWIEKAREQGCPPDECLSQDCFYGRRFPDQDLILDDQGQARLVSSSGTVNWVGPLELFPASAVDGGGVVWIQQSDENQIERSPVLKELSDQEKVRIGSDKTLERFLAPTLAPNLMTGALQSHQSGFLGFIPRPYRSAARLVLLAVLMNAAFYLAQTGYWAYQAHLGSARLAEELHQVAPNEAVSNDVLAQLSGILQLEKAKRVGGGEFVLALKSTEALLATHLGRVTALHFLGHRLTLELSCDNPSCVEGIKDWASKNTWSFEVLEGKPLGVSVSQMVKP